VLDDLEQAETRLRLGDYRGAMAVLAGRTDAPALLLLGECQKRAGDTEAATRTWALVPDHPGARLRAGRTAAMLGHHDLARRHLRAGVELVRADPGRVAEPGRLLHDLLVASAEVAYRTGADDGDRLLGEAARAWPASPHPLVLLALRSTEQTTVRRLLAAALARVEPERIPELLRDEYVALGDYPHRAFIWDVLLTHGVNLSV
jgi:hypothetical protein